MALVEATGPRLSWRTSLECMWYGVVPVCGAIQRILRGVRFDRCSDYSYAHAHWRGTTIAR